MGPFQIPRSNLDNLAVQRDVASSLARALARRRLAHAYLFAGPRGIGKEAVAYALGLAALCPERPFEGCGVCNTCRRVLSDLHPDFRRYAAAGAHFDVETARDVQAEAYRPPSESRIKVLLIVEPEKMTYRNDVSANALLKTLEEPPGSAVFILLSHDPRPLLPTIVSRCVNVNFPRLKAEELEAVLTNAGLAREDAAAAAVAAEGTLEGAARVVADDYGQQVDAALALLEALPRGGVAAAFAAAAVTRDREEALRLVAILGDITREVAALRAGVPPSGIFPKWAERYRVLADAAVKNAEDTWETLARAAEALHGNANVALTLEELFLTMAM